MRPLNKEQELSSYENGPDGKRFSLDETRSTGAESLEKISYLEGRSPSGTWSLGTLLDLPPGPDAPDSA